MAAQVVKVHAAPTTAMVDLPIVPRMRFAPVWNTFRSNTSEDRVEFRLADLERVVVDVELFDVVIEIQREGFIDPHRREISDRACVRTVVRTSSRRTSPNRLCSVPAQWCG